jgi:hypothetical protein
MIAPHCLIRGHQSTDWVPDVFAEQENGIVGLAVRFVAGSGTKQLHGIESSPFPIGAAFRETHNAALAEYVGLRRRWLRTEALKFPQPAIGLQGKCQGSSP